MRTTKVNLLITAVLLVAACRSVKKSTATVAPAPATPAATTNSPATKPVYYAVPKPATAADIPAPGEEALAAIQAQYKEVTLEKLQEGYYIYTKGACINCHEAMSISRHDEAQWKTIIDEMARKAMMADNKKDAVYKYVLAIKATQPK